MSGERVLGGDACKGGWIGIVLSARNPGLHFAAGIGDLVDEAGQDGPLEVIAIDIPIGLPDAGPRQADTLARKAAGPRRASVFVTPVRAVLEAGDYESASAMRRHLLADAGIVLAGNLGIAGERAGVDDVLDAAAAGWTALRVARGQAR